ncbi:hypothetical protein MNV49_006193 [Pseudohyphozyma bogoriensis]|nr:hypothetical protein MNV49_006193 [Pseudohyphozyma bogoriensis]
MLGFRNLSERLEQAVEDATSSRPQAARSGAGVFGALMLGAMKPASLFTKTPGHSPTSASEIKGHGDYFSTEPHHLTEEERERREWEKELKRRKRAREVKQHEIFITHNVASVRDRREFIMKLSRAFMMFGSASHRLQAQIEATARILEVDVEVVLLPGLLLLSFTDPETYTSEIKANGLDLGKILLAYSIYYKVIHDKLSATEASKELDLIMLVKPKYRLWQQLVIGGLASASIMPSAFYGSFIDMLVGIPLGMLLVGVQILVSRNDLYSSLFEIVIACVNSVLAAALAYTGQFCFSAVASGSVVLILPGYIVLTGSLELANRSIISGSVRLVYSILYALFLGFGLSLGELIYEKITGTSITNGTNYTCSALRVDAPWYRATIPTKIYILTVPIYLIMLALRNQQPVWHRESPMMIIIGSLGYIANFYVGEAFPNRSDISAGVGCFVVGVLGNLWGKPGSNAFVVSVVGVLLQLPSGLSNGGLLASTDSSSSSYAAGFTTAASIIQVAVGITVVLSYCCLEVPFSVYYRYLAIKANARRASPQYTRKYLRNLLKKSLENGLGEDDFDEDPLEALMLSRVKTHESVRDDRETESIPMMRHRKATIHSTPDLTATALPRVGTNPSYAASDDTSSEKAYAPSFIPTPLSPEDPRARDFRDFLRLWFHNCEFDDICRLDMAEWLAWSLYGQPLDELVAEREAWEKAGHPPLHVDGEPDIDEDGLDIEGDKLGLVEHCVELVEARAARIFPPGRNVDVKVIRLTLDRVRVISRPLILYVFVWSLQKVVITNARRKGMQEKTEGNFRYLIRTPPGWTPDRDGPESKRPLLFIHGLGMGMAQYATLVNHLATSPVFKDRPLFFLVQPHISMSFFSKGYLHPPNQKSLSADVKRVAVRNGFDKSGMTVLSHSNGTMVHGWLLKEIPEMITRSCFVDPVCFALWEPYVCYNFLYASARTPIEYLMRYFVSRE